MSTTAAKQAGGAEKVRGGTVVNAGTPASDSPITETMNPNELATGGSDYGSKVLPNAATGDSFTDPAGVQKVKSGGTGGLAYFPDHKAGERNFIVKAAGDSAAKINNDATTLLTVPGAEYDGVGRDQIHAIFDTRQHGTYATASFNVLATPGSGVVPGRTIGTNAGSESNFVSTSGNFTYDVDDAATPTRAVPGELTYHFGGLGRPTTDEYKARDSNE